MDETQTTCATLEYELIIMWFKVQKERSSLRWYILNI